MRITTFSLLLVLTGVLTGPSLKGQEQYYTGKLRELTETSVTFIDRSNVMDAGQLRTFARTQATVLENCAEADIRPGAEIAITTFPTNTGDTAATRVYFYSCREQVGMTATVVAVAPPSVTVRTDRFDSPFPRGADVVVTTSSSTQVSTCRNEALDLTTLEVGREVNVYGQLTLDGTGIDASWFATADDCPQTTLFNCVIRSVTDTSVVVEVDAFGQFEALFPIGYGGRDTATVYLDQCGGDPYWWSDVVSGDSAQGIFQVSPRGPSEVYQLTIVNDCPPGLDFGFGRNAIIGTIASIESTFCTVLTPLGVEVVVAIGDTTTFADCTGRPFDRSNLAVGDDAYIVAARDLDTLRASLIVRSSNCTVEHVTAVIEREGVDEMVIRLENGRTLTVILDEDIVVTDCAGRQRRTDDPALRERSGTFLLNTAADPARVRSISMNIDCPEILFVSGAISAVADSVITITTLTDSVFLYRSVTTLIDTLGQVVDWSDARVDDLVCGQIATIGSTVTAAYVLLGMDCDGMTKPRPLIARGVVVGNDIDDMRIDGPDGEITFAVTDDTRVQGAPSRLSIEIGTVVEVYADQRKPSLQPIASRVRVEQVTSVDDDITPGESITPLAYPQPAFDVLSFTDAVRPGTTVSLLSLDGQTIASTNGRSLRVDTFDNGCYLLHCTMPDGTVRVQPVMILR